MTIAFLDRLLSLGQSDAIPDRLSRHVRVTNALALLGAVLSLASTPLDAVGAPLPTVVVDVVSTALFALCWVLNARGHRDAARVVLLLTANVSILSGVLQVGAAAELRTVFFPLVLQPLFSGGKAPSAEAEALAVKTFEEDAAPMFAYLEKELGDRDYFVGNQLTIADITVAATLVNARHAGFAPARKKFPKLRAFLDRMWSRPSLKKLIEEDTPIFGKRAERITD